MAPCMHLIRTISYVVFGIDMGENTVKLGDKIDEKEGSLSIFSSTQKEGKKRIHL